MKSFICGIFIILTSIGALGQARPGTYPWSITLKVVDDNGNPVVGARAWVAYGSPKEGESSDPFRAAGWAIAGLTDSNGLFSASRVDRSWSLGIHVQKEGCYSDYLHYTLFLPGQFDEQKVTANRNTTFALTLKKITKLIPMCARRIEGGPPAFNKPVGYDLMVGDWVNPYGKGIDNDFVFTGELSQKAKNDFDYKLTVTFSKQDDGIQEFSVRTDDLHNPISELRSAQQAPAKGYQNQMVRTMSRHPGQGTKEDMNDPRRNYYFRVRTAVDDRGNIVSAHYGKIYGDFMQFRYYLNPTPNDRNVEFDTKQNLLKGLKALEQVSEP